MNNNDVKRDLDYCASELSSIDNLIKSCGATSNISLYLTKYSIILACGTIERAFKNLLSDYCCRKSKKQVKNFINTRIRNGSANPSWSNICKFVNEFDRLWLDTMKINLKAKKNWKSLETSLDSLVAARNDFSHGGNPNCSIGDVTSYFKDAREVIEEIDTVIG